MRFTPIQNAFLSTDRSIAHESELSTREHGNAYEEWRIAIVAMEKLLDQYCQLEVQLPPPPEHSKSLQSVDPFKGVIFSGPTPVLYQPSVLVHFQTCLWVPLIWARAQPQLLPSQQSSTESSTEMDYVVPLGDSDPLLLEQFCVVLTQQFCWAAALSQNPQSTSPFFAISFNPNTIKSILYLLIERTCDQRPSLLPILQQWIKEFPPVISDYHWPMAFSRQVLTQSTQIEKPSVLATPTSNHVDQSQTDSKTEGTTEPKGHDIELLKAIAHEIRTPLATIQTLTRLLIRRKDLPDDVILRLESIQQECIHQMDRFGLIFRAIELTTTPSASLNHSLTTMSLQQLFAQKMARWESILERRSLEFEVALPEDLPAIAIRDPNMLDQVLTGLIEQLSHTLPLGSQISLRITLAGEQLKLQLRSAIPDSEDTKSSKSMLKAVGQLLMLQPETGNLSLSLPATKEIFNFLGGKLTVRQSPPRGEVLTMFLPLDPLTTSFI